MNPKVKFTVLPLIVLFLHLYLVGALLSIFFMVKDSEWSMDENNPNTIGAQMIHWKSDYMIGLHGVEVAFSPKSEVEKKIRTYLWFACPFVMVFVFFGSPKSWGSGKFKDASGYGSHGSSRWARRKEIFRKGDITGNPLNELNGAGIILGYEKKMFGNGEYITIPPDAEINQNVMVYGNSGIGKGYTYVKTQIFHTMTPFEAPTKDRLAAAKRRGTPTEYSLFVTDPKGEHYKDTAQSLMDEGYEVYAFNLITMKASHRWNPMDYIDEDLDAQKLANLIISQSGEGESKNDFWEKAEKALMSAIILFVKYELPPEQANIANVLHIGLAYGRDEDTLNLLFDSLPYNHPAVSQYNIFRVAPAETRAGILIGFGTQISLFGYREIQKLTSQSDFRLDDMARKKTALFLIIPDSDTTYAAITSLFMNQAIQQWWKVADENGGTCPVGVRILGDELTNIGKIPMLGKRTSVMRSKGVSIQIIIQAKSQLYDVYKDEADIIIQNCDTVIFLGTNDKKTAEELSNDLGDMTIQVSSTSQQQNAFFTANPNESKQYQARKLMDQAELRRATRKLNIIVQNGSYPFKTVKTPFTNHPNAKGFVSLDPKAVTPPPHRGFELFSQNDYNNICGLNLMESSVTHEEATKNFNNVLKESESFNVLNEIDLHEDHDEVVYYAEPIEEIDEDLSKSEVEGEFITHNNEVAASTEQDLTQQLKREELDQSYYDELLRKNEEMNGLIERENNDIDPSTTIAETDPNIKNEVNESSEDLNKRKPEEAEIKSEVYADPKSEEVEKEPKEMSTDSEVENKELIEKDKPATAPLNILDLV